MFSDRVLCTFVCDCGFVVIEAFSEVCSFSDVNGVRASGAEETIESVRCVTVKGWWSNCVSGCELYRFVSNHVFANLASFVSADFISLLSVVGIRSGEGSLDKHRFEVGRLTLGVNGRIRKTILESRIVL